MIVDERIRTYINSLEKTNSRLLEDIEQKAHKDGVPIIRKEMESFLRVMLLIKKPTKILELGTAVGYSAILMSECIEKDAKIVTIENYGRRIKEAKENIKKADREKTIELLGGDAMEIMPTLVEEQFDFVFMDPPYDQDLERQVLTYLSGSELIYEDTVIIVEASKHTDFSYLEDLGFTLIKEKEYKTNKHVFIEKAGKEMIC